MSWVQKELKRRAAATARESARTSILRDDPPGPDEPSEIAGLWETIEKANDALPAELRLRRDADPAAPAGDLLPFISWLVAPNGAAIGFNGEGIRYLWPQPNAWRSNNFWIRWRGGDGYRLFQRVRSLSWGMHIRERRFDPSKIDVLIRYMVTGIRIRPRSVARRKFGLF